MNIENILNLNEEVESFHTNIEKETIENSHFRKVLFTSKKLQLVVMSLKPEEEIGLETHSENDQFIRVDKGSGKAIIGEEEFILKDGDAIIIASGKEHNIIAGEKGLKLYTLYSPPHHDDKAIHKTKDESEKEH